MSDILIRIHKYIFLITLGAASLLGLSLAYLMSVVVAYMLAPQPALEEPTRTAAGTKRAEQATVHRAFEDFETVITGNFYRDSGVVHREGGPGEEAGGEIQLVGLLAGSPDFARAAVQIQGKNEVDEYKIGDTVAGHRIVRINSNSITVERGGQTLDIMMGDKQEGKEAQPDAKTSEAKGAVTKGTISAQQISKCMNDDKCAMAVKASPFTLKGKMMGLRVLQVPSNHPVYALGARPGDIIRRFNGEKLDTQDKMIAIYQALKQRTLKQISIDLERSGKQLSFELKVTD